MSYISSTFLDNAAFSSDTISGVWLKYDFIIANFRDKNWRPIKSQADMYEGMVVRTRKKNSKVESKMFELFMDDFVNCRYLVTRVTQQEAKAA